MNTSLSPSADALEAQFGRRIADRLASGAENLPHDIGERLRAARVQAVARRKLPVRQPAAVFSSGGFAMLGSVWWTRLGAVVPLVALVAGLITISVWQEENRFSELAEVDSALLTDDLPPDAYTDPGFAQFIKTEAAANR
jgi:hypothetical protein